MSAADYVIGPVRYLSGQAITDQAYYVAVRGQKIVSISLSAPRARKTIAAPGAVLAPGFIDTNAVGYCGTSVKLFDGVTSYLLAHGDAVGNRAKNERVPAFYNIANTVSIAPWGGALADAKFDVGAALDEGLRRGAYGVALSPEYNARATEERVRQICAHFAGRQVPISFHLRYSDRAHELEGVREALACAAMGNPVHLLHLSSTGATYHPSEAWADVELARAKGHTVLVDFYPYTAWNSSVRRARFAAGWEKRFEVGPRSVWVSGKPGEKLSGAQVAALTQNLNVTVDSIPQSTVDFFALKTNASIGSDSAGRGSQNTHPRAAGSFAKFFADYVRTGRVPLAQALYRFSTQPARDFARYVPSLSDRGEIRVGAFADLVLWDVARMAPRSSYAEPLAPSEGVVAAWVNGVMMIDAGREVAGHGEPGVFMPGRGVK